MECIRRTKSTANAPRHDPLRKIHGIRDRQYDELRANNRRPVEEVVDDILFDRHELIELVHEDDTRVPGRPYPVTLSEMACQFLQRLLRAHPQVSILRGVMSRNGFPEQSVCGKGFWYAQTIDFDVRERVGFL